jgi:hypothetical protein
LELWDSVVSANTAVLQGGGIWNSTDPVRPGTVFVSGSSSVTDNDPDDCVGTPAC